MGFFSKFKKSNTNIPNVFDYDKKLFEDSYIESGADLWDMMGLGRESGKEVYFSIVKETKQRLKSGNFRNITIDDGYKLLEQEKTDSVISEKLAIKRLDGVTDSDILWWYGLTSFERVCVAVEDQEYCNLTYFMCKDRGKTKEESIDFVYTRRIHFYEEEIGANSSKGENAPLPTELRNRISQWALPSGNQLKYFNFDEENWKKNIEGFSSLNAMVRQKIRIGEI